jgi:hypothetical protein
MLKKRKFLLKCKNYLQKVTGKYMKVALVCDSPLLKKSLEIYLKESVSTYEACDFVISDKKVKSKKPILFIGNREDATLKVPFSKEEVLSKTQQFYQRHLKEKYHDSDESALLEKELAKLHKKHKEKIARIIREFHGER